MRTFFFCFIELFSWCSVLAQEQNRITAQLSNASFDEFVKTVESQTSFHFFYDHRSTDSLLVNTTANDEALPNVLKRIFDGTRFSFSVYQESIFITQGRELYTFLPYPLFDDDVESTTPARRPIAYVDFDLKEQSKDDENKVYRIGDRANFNSKGRATISGMIKSQSTGEPIVGAAVVDENSTTGVSSDPFGRFQLELSTGSHSLKFRMLGMKPVVRRIFLLSTGSLNIEMAEEITPLKEVLVRSDKDAHVTSLQMGVQKLDIKMMKQIPLALGETDVLKAVTALPGVQTVGEGTLGLNVRGGSTSQNQILFNDAFVYNPAHFFGFFSTFNPDVVKSVELYKSGITADYGGRLSSVLDIRAREGNQKKLSASGGISPVAVRLTVEGPLIKDKTSFLVGVRSTYSDWVMRQVDVKSLLNSKASFYDITANVNHKINENNSLLISAYNSSDKFRLNNDTSYQYSNLNASAKWTHVFNSKLYGYAVGSFSQYRYRISGNENPATSFNMDYSVGQANLKADFTYYHNTRHTFSAGVSALQYSLSPGNMQPSGSQSAIASNVLQNERARESALYIGDNIEVSRSISVYAGMRYSSYQYLGAKDVYAYVPGLTREVSNMVDTLHYGQGKTIANYGGFEPRFSLRYRLSDNASLKFSYNRMRQYIQMLSNTTAITPTDVWKLSDTYIKPQVGDQFSIGFYKNLKQNLVEASIEAYTKTIQNTIDYKGGAQLLLNHHIETDVLNSSGKAYGIELLIKKSSGKINGWVSYTYSRSFLKTVGSVPVETINRGEYYPSSYDKPHAFNFIGNYKFSRRYNFSLNAIYSTGRPITVPVGAYTFQGTTHVFYSDRNQYRVPDYFRIDASFNIEGNHKIKKLAHSSWTLAVYNLLGRHNAYSVYYLTQENSKVINGYMLSVFARPIPTLTYNFKF
ncbi:MAG TPA: TonB-dependent receptor [Cyclobacteriaceae bacterium]|nr:TonB-dependent receptor [Cyclobacteriaceae bacterium]